jgi:hypothetical protein
MSKPHTFKEYFELYNQFGFRAVRCGNNKIPIDKEWQTLNLNIEQCAEHVINGGWLGWKVPAGFIDIDVDTNHATVERVLSFLHTNNITAPVMRSPNGIHVLFRDDKNLAGATKVLTSLGLVTYRTGGSNNQVIMAPAPGREWVTALQEPIPVIPPELLPIKKHGKDYKQSDAKKGFENKAISGEQYQKVYAALSKLKHDRLDIYQDLDFGWIQVGMALFELGVVGLHLWDEFSKTSSKESLNNNIYKITIS